MKRIFLALGLLIPAVLCHGEQSLPIPEDADANYGLFLPGIAGDTVKDRLVEITRHYVHRLLELDNAEEEAASHDNYDDLLKSVRIRTQMRDMQQVFDEIIGPGSQEEIMSTRKVYEALVALSRLSMNKAVHGVISGPVTIPKGMDLSALDNVYSPPEKLINAKRMFKQLERELGAANIFPLHILFLERIIKSGLVSVSEILKSYYISFDDDAIITGAQALQLIAKNIIVSQECPKLEEEFTDLLPEGLVRALQLSPESRALFMYSVIGSIDFKPTIFQKVIVALVVGDTIRIGHDGDLVRIEVGQSISEARASELIRSMMIDF